MKYAITGVDGKLCSRVVNYMLEEVDGSDLILTCYRKANIRKENLEKWEKAGATIFEADYDDKEALLRAFKGANKVYIVSGLQVGKRVQQHKNAIDAAVENGVEHIIYSSFLGATDPRYAHSYVTPDHTATENYIKNELDLASKGITWNTLRNNLYLENYLTMYPMLAFMLNNEWYSTAGEGVATFIHKDDAARCVVGALLGRGEPNVSYNICGREAISVRQICELVSKNSGVDLKYVPCSKEEYFDYLAKVHVPALITGDFSQSPVPFCGSDIVMNDLTVQEGLMNVESNAVEILTGKPAKTAAEIIEESAYVWREHVTNWSQMK